MKNILSYKVGGLLYCPASNLKIADKVIRKSIPYLTSLALCLEDSILESELPEAENALLQTLQKLYNENDGNLPLIFIRAQNAEQLVCIWQKSCIYEDIISGFILPKFDLSNAKQYIDTIIKINGESRQIKYIMPIFESRAIMSLETRYKELFGTKKLLDEIQDYVLNIRVGGNDFSNIFGLRRSITHTIYDIEVVKSVIFDIYNVFGCDYIVSGPVWEYIGGEPFGDWSKFFCKEIELDLQNGLIGKTAIHPCQLPIIYEALKVAEEDYLDALRIIDDQSHKTGVEKSISGARMNEFKTNTNWAKKIIARKEIYGVK